jgi:hypothetical protein
VKRLRRLICRLRGEHRWMLQRVGAGSVAPTGAHAMQFAAIPVCSRCGAIDVETIRFAESSRRVPRMDVPRSRRAR